MGHRVAANTVLGMVLISLLEDILTTVMMLRFVCIGESRLQQAEGDRQGTALVVISVGNLLV